MKWKTSKIPPFSIYRQTPNGCTHVEQRNASQIQTVALIQRQRFKRIQRFRSNLKVTQKARRSNGAHSNLEKPNYADRHSSIFNSLYTWQQKTKRLVLSKSHHPLAQISPKSRKSFRNSLNCSPLIALLVSIPGHAINARDYQRIPKIFDNKCAGSELNLWGP
jgi:hypothetical protein